MTLIKRAIVSIVLGLTALFSAWYFISPKFNQTPPTTMIATSLKPSKPVTPFELTDANGAVFNQKSLRGHWTLLFFGYMGCPDICPKTLGIMRDTWHLYNADSPAPARFVFVSITPITIQDNKLRDFLGNYHQDFIGVGGTASEVKRLSDQLGIYYQSRADGEHDHTASLMLIDPQGRLTAVFTPPFIAQEIVKDLDALTKS